MASYRDIDYGATVDKTINTITIRLKRDNRYDESLDGQILALSVVEAELKSVRTKRVKEGFNPELIDYEIKLTDRIDKYTKTLKLVDVVGGGDADGAIGDNQTGDGVLPSIRSIRNRAD